VYLDRAGNEGSWFIIEPAYKHYVIGDSVAAGNKISLIPYSVNNQPSAGHVKHQLHLSHCLLKDHQTAAEVNCLNESTEWQVYMFLLFNENQPDIVKSVSDHGIFSEKRRRTYNFERRPLAKPKRRGRCEV
ncbi:hypothetical protein ANCDUO_22139, partial [Ancylostoma duodenale]